MGSIFADVVPLDRDVFSIRSGKGNWSALLPEFIQVEFDGLSHVSVHLFAGSSDAYATRQVGNNIGRIARLGFLDYDCVSHFNPACFRILESVPVATSEPR